MIDSNLVDKLRRAGTLAGDRVYTGNAIQDATLPFIVLRRAGGSSPRTLDNRKLFGRAQYEINSIGANYEQAWSVSNAISELLDGYRGNFGTAPDPLTKIESCRLLADPVDLSEAEGDKVYRRISQEFLIVYQEQ